MYRDILPAPEGARQARERVVQDLAIRCYYQVLVITMLLD